MWFHIVRRCIRWSRHSQYLINYFPNPYHDRVFIIRDQSATQKPLDVFRYKVFNAELWICRTFGKAGSEDGGHKCNGGLKARKAAAEGQRGWYWRCRCFSEAFLELLQRLRIFKNCHQPSQAIQVIIHNLLKSHWILHLPKYVAGIPLKK